ncbi:hypothetical protein ALQ64_01963 [Pseudomonas cannabina]|uniref:Uncharacterized protein n=1 Tax=Pseudomonas cannabina TaxID=86840 RepID=A0A3M3LQ07_PSECA|nr:DotG/IcmE/VirB10 family protein [Pseudomonas cannabina]RMN37389.1 hypothetical protein ALQ64_01963 [Pseudomonas cannabina]
MNDKSISDDDLNVVVDQSDRLGGAGYSDQISVKPVRGQGAVKALFNKENRFRLVLAAVVGLILCGALIWTYSSFSLQKPPQGNSGTVQSGRVYSEANSTTTQSQIDEAKRYNDERLPQEQLKNPNEHPVIVVGEGGENPFGKTLEQRPATRANDLKSDDKSGLTNTSGSSSRAQAARSNEARDWKATDDFITKLLTDEGAAPTPLGLDWNYRAPATAKKVAAVSNTEHSDSTSDGANPNATNKCSKPATRAATMYMATTDLALNSDVGGPVSLTIQSGRLKNSKLVGKFERKEEWLRMELDKLVTKEATLPVQAIGLDMSTTMNAVQGEADYHTLYRYGWWGVGSALKAIGKAAEMNADSNVIISNGTALQTTQADTAREMKIAIGSLGQDLGDVMRERLNRPVTVTLRVNDEVGVFFMDDVCLPNQVKGN